jgi:Leucine-rich repeat (LRR) protein
MNKIQIKKCYPYNLYKLKYSLDLSNQQISDISFLRDLLILNDLNLETNFISDISPLNKLFSLEIIILFENRITDISSLKNLIGLEYLDLVSNDDIPEKQIIELDKALPYCTIYANNMNLETY